MGIQKYGVSRSGQLSLPAEVRRRWNLSRGGSVDVIDLGFAVLTLPEGHGTDLLTDLLSRDEHAVWVAELDDPDLTTS